MFGTPRAEDDEFVMAVGNARPLDQALQHATAELLRMLAESTREYIITLAENKTSSAVRARLQS